MGRRILSVAILALTAASYPLMAQNNPETVQAPSVEQPAAPPADQPAAPSAAPSAEQPTTPPAAPSAASPAAPPGGETITTPPFTILGSKEVQSIVGREVRSTGNEDMGRIVDVIVDGEGRPRAAIVDFGGFLGVGSRKIAVDWKALHFVPTAAKRYGISLELSRDQLKAAPEYKEGRPVVVLGASGSLEPLP